MRKLKILVACEESQTSCIAFRDLGHDAFSCDLQECSGGHPEWHILGDCLSLINGNCDFITESGDYYSISKWDLILAHPPCTYLSAAGARFLFAGHKLNKERFNKLLLARDFFLKIYHCNCEHLCIENPRPVHIAKLPRPDDIVDPTMFGSPFTKRTYLWLRNLPPVIGTCFVPFGKSYVRSCSNAKSRSKSDPFMYRAIAKQFVDYILSV